jgi:hypothetical protein
MFSNLFSYFKSDKYYFKKFDILDSKIKKKHIYLSSS